MDKSGEEIATKKEARELSPRVDLPTKRRRKHGGRPNRSRRDNRKSRFDADYTGEADKHNENFEAYYRVQNIVPEEEFSTLLQTLTIPLPTSFRVSAAGAFRDSIQSILSGEMTELFQNVSKQSKQGGNILLKPLTQLPWYPDGLAWTVSAPRQMLRRDNVLAPFHKFIVRMNDIGAINRQEAVSMIPPLLLDVQEGHSVIDLCAAPGSKTAQMLESVSGSENQLSSEGAVVANDADLKRSWMLVHQLRRFGSPKLIVTHHEAQHFPKFMMFDRVLCDVPCSGDGTLRKAPDMWRRWNSDMGISLHRLQCQIAERGVDILKPGGRLVYSTCSMNPLENEAVVAHVLRKYGDDMELIDCSEAMPELIRRPGLKTWLVKNNSTRKKSVTEPAKNEDDGSVATKKVEGCDEAVTVKKETSIGQSGTANKEDGEDAVTLEEDNPGDAKDSNQNDSVKTGWFRSFDKVPLKRRERIVESMFPMSKDEVESGRFALERCMRLLPHDQDTGAFFVAVLRKKATARLSKRQTARMSKVQRREEEDLTQARGHDDKVSKEKLEEESADAVIQKEDNVKEGNSAEFENMDITEEDNSGANVSDKPNTQKDDGKKAVRATRLIADEPLNPVRSVSSASLDNMIEYFGLDGEVAKESFMTRGSDESKFKRVVGVSRTVRAILCHAVGTPDTVIAPEKRTVRVVNSGVRLLERTDRKNTTCRFRIIHDGVSIMRGMMGKRVLRDGILKEEVVRLLREKSVKIADLQDKVAEAEDGSNVIGFWKKVIETGSGSAVMVCEGEDIIVWIGKRVVDVVMANEVIDALLMRFQSLSALPIDKKTM